VFLFSSKSESEFEKTGSPQYIDLYSPTRGSKENTIHTQCGLAGRLGQKAD